MEVYHAAKLGADGEMLKETLVKYGVKTDYLEP